MGFAKIHSGIVDSSINEEELHVRWLWVVLLTRANEDGNVFGTINSLARAANITIDQAQDAMNVLTSPDQHSTSPDEEGRRIIPLDGNQWFVVNHNYYRDVYNYEKKKEQGRVRVQRFRQKKSEEPNESLDGNADVTIGNPLQSADTRMQKADSSHTSASPSMENVFLDLFWKRWPTGRKVDRKKCERFFNRLPKKDQEAATGPALDAWLEDFAQRDRQYVPHPYTWLNNRRWEDDVPTRGKKKHSGHVDAESSDEMKSSHAESCDAAIAKIDHLVVALPTPLDGHLLDRLLWLKTEVQSAQEMLPAEGYEKIVAAEDFVLDWAADEYELDAKTTTERRLLARKKIGLPVLY